MKKLLPPTEHQEQAAVIEWYDLWAPPALKGRLAAVPNGGFRFAATAGRQKAEGVRAGYLDLQLLYPWGKYHGLIIEMKRTVGGKVSPEQQDFIDWHNACGFCALVAWGANDAANMIMAYLEGHPDLRAPLRLRTIDTSVASVQVKTRAPRRRTAARTRRT